MLLLVCKIILKKGLQYWVIRLFRHYLCLRLLKIRKNSIQTVKEPFLISMKNDPEIRRKLAEANNVEPPTIQAWLRQNNPLLTTAANLSVIKNHFGLLEASEILEVNEAQRV